MNGKIKRKMSQKVGKMIFSSTIKGGRCIALISYYSKLKFGKEITVTPKWIEMREKKEDNRGIWRIGGYKVITNQGKLDFWMYVNTKIFSLIYVTNWILSTHPLWSDAKSSCLIRLSNVCSYMFIWSLIKWKDNASIP